MKALLLLILAAYLGLETCAPSAEWRDCQGAAPPPQRIEACTEIIKAGGLDAVMLAAVHAHIGKAHTDLGEPEKALAEFDEALRLDPRSFVALDGRGSALIDIGKMDAAITDFNKLFEMASPPEDPALRDELLVKIFAHAVRERGYAYNRNGQPDLAVADFDRLIKYAPSLHALHFADRALAFENLGDEDRALADYRKAAELDPQDDSFYFDIGRIYFGLGNFDAAVENIKRYSEPNGYGVLWLYLAQGRNGGGGSDDLVASASKADQDWPYPLIEFYLGNRTREEIYRVAADDGQRCEADFYVAQWELLKGDKAAAKPLLKAAVEKCWKTFVEYPAAVAELKRID